MWLSVGEKERVRVTPTWSGLVDYGNGVHWTFASDNPRVATGSVRLDSAAPQDFDIIATGPGIAHIRQDGAGWPYVTIRVSCETETPAVAATPLVTATLGREVRLAVISEYASRATFRWYLGTIGDTSHPLFGIGAELVFTPESYGSNQVWAEVATTCSISHVQFRIDVPTRTRAVGKPR